MESDESSYRAIIETFENVIKNLTSDEIVNLCLTNSKFKFICDVRSTWINLLKKEYGVDQLTMSDPRAEYIARKRYPPEMKITLKKMLEWLSQQYSGKLVCFDGFGYRFLIFERMDGVQFLNITPDNITNGLIYIEMTNHRYDSLTLYALDNEFNRSFVNDDEVDQIPINVNDVTVLNMSDIFRMIPLFDDEIVYYNAYSYHDVFHTDVYFIGKSTYEKIFDLIEQESEPDIKRINGMYEFYNGDNTFVLSMDDKRLNNYFQQKQYWIEELDQESEDDDSE